MSCTKLVADILNNCARLVRGNKPLAYWQYRNQVSFTFSENEITAINTYALGTLESSKFGINSGNDIVASENTEDGFKHKLSAVFVATTLDLDTMDDIVAFVQNNNNQWVCLGARHGLWKESQAKMANDNLSTVSVEFGSREGMEELYGEFVIDGALLDALPKTTSTDIDASALTFTAEQVASLLSALVYAGNTDGTLDISGANIPDIDSWSAQAITDMQTLINDNDWSVTYNLGE